MLVSATFHDCAIFMAFLLLVPTLRPETCSTLTPIFSAIIGRMWSRTPKRKRHPTYCRPSTNEHHLLFLIYGWQVKTTCTSVTSTDMWTKLWFPSPLQDYLLIWKASKLKRHRISPESCLHVPCEIPRDFNQSLNHHMVLLVWYDWKATTNCVGTVLSGQ